jgi:hypothetical protein
MKLSGMFLLLVACAAAAHGQISPSSDYQLALPEHKGQLKWSIDGFKIVENSAKPNGSELGVRGRDSSGRLTFLGFLFTAPETAPMTSAGCRDAALTQDKKADATLKIVRTAEIPRSGGFPVALVTHTTTNRNGSTTFRVRGFVATADICGDLEFYSSTHISDDDADLKRVFRGFDVNPDYIPQFSDVVLYV